MVKKWSEILEEELAVQRQLYIDSPQENYVMYIEAYAESYEHFRSMFAHRLGLK